MPGIFEIDSFSDLEIGQIVQTCDCAEIRVDVVSRADDRQAIDFDALILHVSGRTIFARGETAAGPWTSGSLSSGACRVRIVPRVGPHHHDFRSVPLDEVFEGDVTVRANMTTTVTAEISRKMSIIYDIPYEFRIAENESADASRPFIESEVLANLTTDWNGLGEAMVDAAERFGVPLGWVRAICWMEITHGHYDVLFEPFGMNATLRPMNINVEYWSRLFSRSDMEDMRESVTAGAFFLRRLRDRTTPETLRRVATLYNSTGETAVTDYGARVESIHNQLYVEGKRYPD
ncbi:hypothetical protein [Jannaschia marina]|uniref:hypothetical protein n=1 Tax=Jannaschia marina TaxID=2741674 RepID=UPI0015CDAFAE|nr:hypothetical protein [Jannaschia marina]